MDTTAATYSFVGALRVKKVVGATTTVYVFSGSKVIAEYGNGALSKEYVYAGAQLLATVQGSDGAVTYQHPDHLSVRTESDSAGNLTRGFGHFPFGETWYEAPATNKWKFTSYERDSESGVDYAMFRNYSSRLGRFMQADPLSGGTSSPQSLDRYSYVGNDPSDGADPLGLINVKLSAVHLDWRCSLDGIATPCSLVYDVLAAGAGWLLPPADSGWSLSRSGRCWQRDGSEVSFCPDSGPFASWQDDPRNLVLVAVSDCSTGENGFGNRNIFYSLHAGSGKPNGNYYVFEHLSPNPLPAGSGQQGMSPMPAAVGDFNNFKDGLAGVVPSPNNQWFTVSLRPDASGGFPVPVTDYWGTTRAMNVLQQPFGAPILVNGKKAPYRCN